MMNISHSLLTILPEITILAGAMIAMIVGVYVNKNKAKASLVISTFFVLLSLYFVSIAESYHFEMTSFNHFLLHNSITSYAKILVLAVTFLILMMFSSLIDKEKYAFFELPVLILFSVLGMMLLISSNSLMSLYMGLELMSLPLYILAASDRFNGVSSEAGLKYFILGSLASGLFLLGTSFIYTFTGFLNFNEIYSYFNEVANNESVVMPVGFLIGLVLILIAFAFKISAVPFHMWAPDVYEGSPTIVTAFFATAPKIAGFIILIRVLFDPFIDLYDQWAQIVAFIAVASMFVGSLGAIMQQSFKRLLAYSSIGHVGFMLVGLLAAEPQSVEAVLVYLSIYVTMTIAAFGILMLLRKDDKPLEKISDFGGLSESHPVFASALTILMLSMAGIPPLAGFFIKFYILIPVIEAGMYSVAVLFVISSVIAAFYYIKVIKIMYFDNRAKQVTILNMWAVKVVIGICVLINVIYVFIPASLFDTANLVSQVLFR